MILGLGKVSSDYKILRASLSSYKLPKYIIELKKVNFDKIVALQPSSIANEENTKKIVKN
jgi:hypothetical protein